MLDARSAKSWQRFIWVEDEADCFLINIQCWFKQPSGPDSELFDHKKHAVIALAHGKDPQDCVEKLKASVHPNSTVSETLPIRAILKSLKHRDVIVTLMFQAALIQNKEMLVMWADRTSHPRKLRKLAMRWGLIPTEYKGRTLYGRNARGH